MLTQDESWRAEQRRPAPYVFGALAALSMVPLLVEFGGFRLSPGALLAVRISNFAFAAFFVGELVVGLRTASDRVAYLRRELVDCVVAGVLLATLLLALLHPFGFFRLTGLPGYVRPVQIYLLTNLVLELIRLVKVVGSRSRRPARMFVVSFAAVIAVGFLLLYFLPGAKADGAELGFVDAVFTATSATCVTGLVTVDTGAHFSRFGQAIILFLFQVGGLGLMTFAAFFAIALGKGMGIRDRQAMKGMLDLHVVGTVVRVILGILFITLLVEGVSTLILYGRMGTTLPPHERLFHAAFHAVSAFCNAGFSLHATSLVEYARDPVVNITIMLEIVIGGLGFAVLMNLLGVSILGARLFSWLGLIPRPADGARPRLTVQTRIVLISSAVLILVGGGLIYAFEASNPATLGGLEPAARVQAAFFQSITTRTAGFNTVPIGELTGASKFLMIVLMIVGASPGSTGGGVKTVTSVVLLLTVISFYRNRHRVEAFRRTLPAETVRRALVIVVAAFVLVSTATTLLVAVEGDRFEFLSIFFEVGSAFGTVGLSTGITESLSSVSKLALCLVMFVGRIGPLSLVIALSHPRAPRGYEYPEEHVMIG